MKTFSVLILTSAAMLLTSCGNSHVSEAGGAYAVSPDGRWLAEISDGHSETHNRFYGVIRVWDLNKYPSLAGGVRSYHGKAPTVRLKFPQTFHARDAKCDVSWATNSTEFSIEFANDSNVSTPAVQSLRRFRYDLATDVFSLTSVAPDK